MTINLDMQNVLVLKRMYELRNVRLVAESLGKTSKARESYQICLSGQPDSYDMLLEANLRKALNANSKRLDLYKELERLLKEPKNKQYGDRIYFALAQVAKKRKDVDQQLYFLKGCF